MRRFFPGLGSNMKEREEERRRRERVSKRIILFSRSNDRFGFNVMQ